MVDSANAVFIQNVHRNFIWYALYTFLFGPFGDERHQYYKRKDGS
jgi:hypothetical protein